MRVLVIAGLDRSLLNFRLPLIRDLLAAGHEVTCCAPAEHPEAARKLADLGVAFMDLPLQRAGLNPYRDLGSLLALRRILDQVQPQVIFAYTHKPIILAGIAARGRNARAYGLVTGLGYAFESGGSRRQRFAAGMLRLLYRIAAPGLKGVLFQNRDDAADFRRWKLLPPACAVAVVPGSGIDLRDFPAAPAPAGGPHFVLLTRLLPSKGVREFAAAAAVVHGLVPHVRFSLAGDLDSGQAHSISRDEVAAWVAGGALEYHGNLPDVRPLLRAGTVCVLPSYYREGVPRCLLEAMAVGRAIITTDAIGCRETVRLPAGTVRDADGILQGENGLLVPVRDAGALARAMARLANDPGLVQQMGARSRAIAEEEFDVRKVNAAMLTAMGIRRAEGDT